MSSVAPSKTASQKGSESLEKELRLASALGALWGLKTAFTAMCIENSHIENTIAATLKSLSVSDVASYLHYQYVRNKKETYQYLEELVQTLAILLNLQAMDKNTQREILLRALLSFKRVAYRKDKEKCVNRACMLKYCCRIVDALKAHWEDIFSKVEGITDESQRKKVYQDIMNQIPKIEGDIISAISCIVGNDLLTNCKCKNERDCSNQEQKTMSELSNCKSSELVRISQEEHHKGHHGRPRGRGHH